MSFSIFTLTGDILENMKILDKFPVCKMLVTGETIAEVFAILFDFLLPYRVASLNRPII